MFIRSALLLSVLVGCGVPDGTLLADVTDEQAVSLCEEAGEARTYTCEVEGMSYDITIGYEDIEDCKDEESYADDIPEGCEATVGDARACSDAWELLLEEDPCTTDFPKECDYFEECVAV